MSERIRDARDPAARIVGDVGLIVQRIGAAREIAIRVIDEGGRVVARIGDG